MSHGKRDRIVIRVTAFVRMGIDDGRADFVDQFSQFFDEFRQV
jgi:hypothetical protein